MPIKESAKKYMRVTKRKTSRNKVVKGIFKNAIKKTREAVKINNTDDAKKWLGTAIKALDKAVQKKTIKKNTAARKKSRLNALVKQMSTGPKKEVAKKKTTKKPTKKVAKKTTKKTAKK